MQTIDTILKRIEILDKNKIKSYTVFINDINQVDESKSRAEAVDGLLRKLQNAGANARFNFTYDLDVGKSFNISWK